VRPPDVALAARLGAGIVVERDAAPAADGALRRIVQLASIPGGDAEDWLRDDRVGAIVDWRTAGRAVGAVGADTLLVVLDTDDLDLIRKNLRLLGSVVAPALRCADFQLAPVTESAWRWLYEKVDAHELPVA